MRIYQPTPDVVHRLCSLVMRKNRLNKRSFSQAYSGVAVLKVVYPMDITENSLDF